MAIKRGPGRPTGSKSQDSLAYQEFFVKKKFCIPEHELWCLKQAKEQYEFYKDKVKEGRFSPMEDHAAKFLKIYQDVLREIASRVYPKLKSIDQTVSGSVEAHGFQVIIKDYTDKKDEK